MANFLNKPLNNREVFFPRLGDTHNTNVDRLVEYLREAFPGNDSKTGINDFYHREGVWPTIQEEIRENQRVFVTAQDYLCDANCRNKYTFFIPVRHILFSIDTHKVKIFPLKFLQQEP